VTASRSPASPYHLASIDPGVKECHLAYFEGGVLSGVWQFSPGAAVHQPLGPCPTGTELVVEVPRIYPHSHPRPNDLIDLAFAAGRAVGSNPATIVYPAHWKRQLKKPVSHMRILEVLAPHELAVLPPETADKVREAAEYLGRTGKVRYNWKGHNTLDAVGIGLHHLGRLK